MKGRGGLVYSTESGRMCPRCRKPLAQCNCGKSKPPAVASGPVRVSRETAGRNGKNVTVIRGVPLAGDALAALGKELKAACGSGGTVKDGVIEVQGDHCDRVIELLGKRFPNVKRSGG